MVKSPILQQRLRNQRLLGSPLKTPQDVVSWLGAVQAQDYSGAKWGLGLRGRSFTEQAVDRAFDEGRLLRTHLLRPTWHFVAPADLRSFLSISGPRVQALNAYYYRKFELEARHFVTSHAAIEKALRGRRFLTRAELATVLAKAQIGAQGARLAAIVMHAELEGLICSGPRRGKQFTYALVDERVPRGRVLPPDEALAELTRRYFRSHGPATIKDFVWWSGLTVAQAKAGMAALQPALKRVDVGGLCYWVVPTSVPAGPSKASTTYLLPNYDEFLIAYKDRDEVLAHRRALAAPPPPQEDSPHHVIVDGQLAGSWRRVPRPSAVQVEVSLFVRQPSARHQRELAAAGRRLSTFLDRPVSLATSTGRRPHGERRIDAHG
jgi:Winged helix DNA-binding domain